MIGVSESWLRKLLPECLKYTNHTRNDYLLKQEQQGDQQPLQHMQQQQQQQPSDDKTTKVTNCDNNVVIISEQTQKEEEEQRGMREELEKNKTIIIEGRPHLTRCETPLPVLIIHSPLY
jgi:hypothetical protein